MCILNSTSPFHSRKSEKRRVSSGIISREDCDFFGVENSVQFSIAFDYYFELNDLLNNETLVETYAYILSSVTVFLVLPPKTNFVKKNESLPRLIRRELL